MSNKAKNSIIVLLAVLLITAIGITFAYFTATTSGNSNSDINVNVGDAAALKFVKGETLTINANMENFGEGKEHLYSTSKPNVILTSSSFTKETYNVYFKINSNDFIYTTEERTPELILSIIKPDGTELETVDGLEYTTENGINGFDVTTKGGFITIVENYEISTESSETDEWIFTLHLVNLDSNQNENNSKTFDSTILMQKEKFELPKELNNRILFNEGGISYIENRKSPDFSKIATTDEGMFSTNDNDGTTYYFRGSVEDNYVKFNNMLWRIIRIDGSGNIKLMLFNTDINSTNYKTEGIGKSSFNTVYNLSKYSDYNISTVKSKVNTWYTANMSSVQKYLAEGSYCVDLENTNNEPYKIIYGTNYRLITNKTPSIVCNTTIEGVDEYTNYSGVISADEIAFAGGTYGIPNENFYLYNNQYYWTTSAYDYSGGFAYSFGLSSRGTFSYSGTQHQFGVFPTITLSKESIYESGNGTISSPYIIETS